MLKELSENESDGGWLSCSNIDSDEDIRWSEGDCEEAEENQMQLIIFQLFGWREGHPHILELHPDHRWGKVSYGVKGCRGDGSTSQYLGVYVCIETVILFTKRGWLFSCVTLKRHKRLVQAKIVEDLNLLVSMMWYLGDGVLA
ncbi:hypothetical protein TNCV_142761 [Trichonephila clavipes]|nr:hypothetical protein TNCV_142761 [Trichonephila clavipes]